MTAALLATGLDYALETGQPTSVVRAAIEAAGLEPIGFASDESRSSEAARSKAGTPSSPPGPYRPVYYWLDIEDAVDTYATDASDGSRTPAGWTL